MCILRILSNAKDSKTTTRLYPTIEQSNEHSAARFVSNEIVMHHNQCADAWQTFYTATHSCTVWSTCLCACGLSSYCGRCHCRRSLISFVDCCVCVFFHPVVRFLVAIWFTKGNLRKKKKKQWCDIEKSVSKKKRQLFFCLESGVCAHCAMHTAQLCGNMRQTVDSVSCDGRDN